MADPYDLLRRARDIIISANGHEDEIGQAWLKDYKKLPGAKLPKTQVHVLRNPHRRIMEKPTAIENLVESGYLQTIHHISRGRRYDAIRLTKEGREALRLRQDVE